MCICNCCVRFTMVDSSTKRVVLQAILAVFVDDEEQRMVTNVLIVKELEKEEMYLSKTPYHNDILIGSELLKNVICNEGNKCLEMFGMTIKAFVSLVSALRQRGLVKDSRYVSADEQVGILLKIIGHNKANKDTAYHFQHFGKTISRHFNSALKATCEFGKEIVRSDDLTIVPPEILNNPKYYPWFEDRRVLHMIQEFFWRQFKTPIICSRYHQKENIT
ncbi:PREDICTED: uncharacterized protein LOC104587588 isoform X2 [Nelumbo nucifera]|uniref:DUF8040 domain-containing protein n=2 Tax=Nelumbo nucifera TaxID=4432 RepID=A0A822YV99_NELNU|nr:PREDICTED: uncharacterized protein LOC104587588 isoform X2 [Nelumbo nucifera]DAD37984.1 TPA_asm: hypothetical protein HUJ06_008625 [Nelumbo nucifera]